MSEGNKEAGSLLTVRGKHGWLEYTKGCLRLGTVRPPRAALVRAKDSNRYTPRRPDEAASVADSATPLTPSA
jgi:hypothetical protein